MSLLFELPVLREFAGNCPDALRRQLKSCVTNTKASPEIELQRSYLAFDWLVRVNAPAFLRLTPEHVEHADVLASLSDLTSKAAVEAATPVILTVHNATVTVRKACTTVGDAYTAAHNAACKAVLDAACNAAYLVARSAARTAVEWNAANNAAWGAVRHAAGAAAHRKVDFKPTVEELQELAKDLFQRMLEVDFEGPPHIITVYDRILAS